MESVGMSRRKPVCWLTMETAALGTTEPVASRTLPRMVPEADWAASPEEKTRAARAANAMDERINPFFGGATSFHGDSTTISSAAAGFWLGCAGVRGMEGLVFAALEADVGFDLGG